MTFIVIHQPYANFHEVSTCVYHKQFATLLGELELLKYLEMTEHLKAYKPPAAPLQRRVCSYKPLLALFQLLSVPLKHRTLLKDKNEKCVRNATRSLNHQETLNNFI
jgi:hypothetical protein